MRMQGYGGPAQPSPAIAQCLNGSLGWLEVLRCQTLASLLLDDIRRRPTLDLEAGSFPAQPDMQHLLLPAHGTVDKADLNVRNQTVLLGLSGRMIVSLKHRQ